MFNILLSSNKNLNYEIKFKSINNKPKHLQFSAIKDGVEIVKTNSLEEITKNGGNPSDYIDNWICFSLFHRDVKRRNLNDHDTRLYLIECIKNYCN